MRGGVYLISYINIHGSGYSKSMVNQAIINVEKSSKTPGGTVDLRMTIRSAKIWLPKSDPYSPFFQNFSPVRAKIFAIFQENVKFFLQNWPFSTISYPYSAVQCSFSKFFARKGENFCNFPRNYGIFPPKLANFVPTLPKNWPFSTISYPYSAVKCNFVISYPYSALAEL